MGLDIQDAVRDMVRHEHTVGLRARFGFKCDIAIDNSCVDKYIDELSNSQLLRYIDIALTGYGL